VLLPLTRRAAAESLGAAGLVCAVVGSGIAAERLSPNDAGQRLLENSTATALALAALIFALAPVSGAHVNPLVTAVEWARRRLPSRDALAYVGAQLVGAALGAMLANAMFEHPLVEASMHARGGASLWLGEVVATAGLLLVVHGATSSANARAAPLAIAGYVGAAYWFTSSTAFANPAVTLARALTDSFAGITPASVPAFVAAQGVGAVVGSALCALVYPGWRRAGGASA
jgi:glycerol uptake facilitator-like aquaporin